MSQAAPTLHSKLASRTGPFGIVAIIAQETAAISDMGLDRLGGFDSILGIGRQ